jgi:hypothetical protein
MATEAFQTAMAALQARIETGEVLAIMCAETLWWRRHPRLIADALTLDGFEVRHLCRRAARRTAPPLGCNSRRDEQAMTVQRLSVGTRNPPRVRGRGLAA